MQIQEVFYEVQYRLRGTDKMESFREEDVRQAYSFVGSIRRMCTHTKIIKNVVYKPSFKLV